MVPVLVQCQYFLWTVGIGLLMAFCFDLYQMLRWTLKPPRFIVHLTDLMFWVLATIAAYLVLLNINWGEVRVYVLLGIGVGAFGYYRLASKRMHRMWRRLFSLVAKGWRVLLRLLRLLAIPFRLVKKILRVPLGLVTLFIYKVNRLLRIVRRLPTIIGKMWARFRTK